MKKLFLFFIFLICFSGCSIEEKKHRKTKIISIDSFSVDSGLVGDGEIKFVIKTDDGTIFSVGEYCVKDYKVGSEIFSDVEKNDCDY